MLLMISFGCQTLLKRVRVTWIKSSANVVSESDKTTLTSISEASNLEEIGEFWDMHSLDDYWEQTQEANFELRAARRRRNTLDPSVYEQVEAAARMRGILPETLVNLWLQDRLREAGTGQGA
jgi:hypothetical protein